MIGLIVLIGYGVVGYTLFGYSLADSIYMTVMTLTTEGFADTRGLSGGAEIFTATVAVLGVTVFVAALGLLGTALVEDTFGPGRRGRRMKIRIDGLRQHFIICAYGRVGQSVAREFEAEEIPFVVIDSNPDLEEVMIRDRVAYLCGSASDEEVLRRAGIERARGLVCAIDSDAENLYVTLIARSVNPTIEIVARAAHKSAAERLTRAGANSVISPYVTSGRRMALLAVRPHVVDFLELTLHGTPDCRLEEVLVDPGSRLVGRSLREACQDALPLLLRRPDGRLVPNPAPTSTLQAGDVLVVFGDPGALQHLEEE